MECQHCGVHFRIDLMSVMEADKVGNFSPVHDVKTYSEKCAASSVSAQYDFHKI